MAKPIPTARAGSTGATSSTQPRAFAVMPNLFFGPLSTASSISFLSENSITHILSIKATPAKRFNHITYHRVSLPHSPKSDVSEVLTAGLKFIKEAITGEGRVYVHCQAGISRSPTVVAAFLMTEYGMTLQEGLGKVILARPSVFPNPGYFRQLKELDERLHGTASLDVDELPKSREERVALFKPRDTR